MSTARARRERGRVVSARVHSESHKGGGYTSKCYTVPESMQIFLVKEEAVKRMSIIPYTVPEISRNPNTNVQPGDLHYELTYFAHKNIGANDDTYPCLAKTFNMPCPICDFRKTLIKDPKADKKLVKRLSWKERQLWNVVDHDEVEKGVQLWEYSYHLFGKQLNDRLNNSDEEDGYEFFHDPDQGMILKVGFNSKSTKAEDGAAVGTWIEATTIDFKTREPIPDEWLDTAAVLDDLLIPYDYKVLDDIFHQARVDPVREPAADSQTPAEAPVQTIPARRARPTATAPKQEEEKWTENPQAAAEPSKAPGGQASPARRSRPTSAPTTPAPAAAKPTAMAKPAPRPVSAPPAAAKPAVVPATAKPASRSKPAAKPAEPEPKQTATDYGIQVNMVVDHATFGQDCSVIKISPDGTAVYILDKKNQKHSVGPEELTIVEFEDDVVATDEAVEQAPEVAGEVEDNDSWDDWADEDAAPAE